MAVRVPVWLHRIAYFGLSCFFIRWLWQIHTYAVLSGLVIACVLTLVSVSCLALTFHRSIGARMVVAAVDVLLPVSVFGSMLAMRILRVSSVLDVIAIPLLLSIPVMFGLSLFLGEDGRLHFHDTKA
jgi:hypothetical protein